MTLLGRLTGVAGGRATFDESAVGNVAFGDQGWATTRGLIDSYVASHRLDAPAQRDDEGGGTVQCEPSRSLHLRDEAVSTVIWCTGFTGDLTYLDLPVLDPAGQVRRDGSASPISGLWFAGFPWLVERRSGIFYGFPVDAARTVDLVAAYLARVTGSG